MITFRSANLNDIASLSQLVNSAYRGEYAKQGWTTEADLLDGQRTDDENLKDIINQKNNEIILAFNDSELIGCVHLIHENPKSLYFGMLTVEPTKQALGVGKKLIEHIVQIARKNKMTQIRISVIPLRKELIAYYERRGFIATGNWEPFPSDPRNGLPKTEGLRLDEYIKHLTP